MVGKPAGNKREKEKTVSVMEGMGGTEASVEEEAKRGDGVGDGWYGWCHGRPRGIGGKKRRQFR